VAKVRLDQLLVARGLAESRERARRLIMAGQVRVAGQLVDRPASPVAEDAPLEVLAPPPYVSRGGEKLAAALARFRLGVRGCVCADLGASTGGFTDCLLQGGAARVYAVDVGYGVLDARLRGDPRVVVLERTNARYLTSLPEPIDLVTADVAFISLSLVLAPALQLLRPEGRIVALIKPQFEAGRGQVGKGGVVRDPAIHRAVLERVLAWAQEHGLQLLGLMLSPLRGPAGNREFLAAWRLGGAPGLDVGPAIASALGEQAA
jgi:23S rRNA (cytidine1920-2'-O)/16S rRNA (cytidine1409-2'-O)-methyltransferase